MMIMNGYYNEFEFINNLNNKYVFQLSKEMQCLLKTVFVQINESDYVYCHKSFKTDKADIVIIINNIKKYVSIKSGKNNSIHLEHINTFEKFLQECGVPLEIIEIYKKYHYATDSSGKRLSAKEYQVIKETEIIKINTKDILLKAIDRFLFKGSYDYNNYVDVLIYGKVDNFNFFTRKEIVDFLMKKSFVKFNCIHFSLLCLQPWIRNLNYNSKYEYRRDYIQVKWYRLEEIIHEII